MNINELVKEDLVIFSDAKEKEAALGQLADLLTEKGKTKATYKQAVLEREQVFPTGLETEHDGIAIPHTDSIHVNEPAVAIAVLKNKIPFIQMGSTDEEVQVEVIFMLALKSAEAQLELLQAFVELIQNKEIMKKLKNSQTPKEVIATIQEFTNMTV